MTLAVFLRLRTAHGFIERLAFYRRMRGEIELMRAVLAGPLFGGRKQRGSHPLAAPLFGDVKAGKVEVLLVRAKKRGFYGNEPFQRAVVKAGVYEPSGRRCTLQTREERLVVFFRPIIKKGSVHDDPNALFFAPAFGDDLTPYKGTKERAGDLFFT